MTKCTKVFSSQDLSPFTTYHVNVSAIPKDRSYRPPAKITVTTQMAAPQPMVKPDFYGVHKESEGQITVFLPQASEEYGPISHYYLVVIPSSNATKVQYPDQYNTADLVGNSKASVGSDKSSSTVPAADGKKVIDLYLIYRRLSRLSAARGLNMRFSLVEVPLRLRNASLLHSHKSSDS